MGRNAQSEIGRQAPRRWRRKAANVVTFRRRALAVIVLGAALAGYSVVTGFRPAAAVEAGEPAPDFKLPSTSGTDISLSDFKGKSFVFLEFYGNDFAPT